MTIDPDNPLGKNCKREGCDRKGRTRGLCDNHYRVAHKLVKDGEATWEELEEHGKVDQLKKREAQLAAEWFLDWRGKRGPKPGGKARGWPKGKKRGPYKKRKKKARQEKKAKFEGVTLAKPEVAE